MYKWTNYVYGWKRRYFVLHSGVLQYCKDKGQERKGAIHLNVAQILPHSRNPRRIIIDTGTTVLHLKASSESDALQWYNALKAAQELLLQEAQKDEIRESMMAVAPALEGHSLLNVMMQKVTAMWDLHSQMEDIVAGMSSVYKSSLPGIENLLKVAVSLKSAAAEVLSMFEEEHLTLTRASKDLPQTSPSDQDPSKFAIDRDLAEFQSFNSHEDLFYDALDEIPVSKTDRMPYRKCLPVLRNPKQKLNVWRVVKDSIGKELSKIAVPVHFNEPISFLQRAAEDLSFSGLLEKADQTDDQWLRLAYVACFAVSTYSTTLHRNMKPFNPVLGETFELEQSGFRLLAEQVSHHPPVTALHCSHPNYTYWYNVTLTSSFKGTYLQINPIGDMHVLLKHREDQFMWNKPTTTAHNIIIGKVYVDHHGTVDLVNTKTGDRCRLTLKKLGWFEKSPHQVEGIVFDSENAPKYLISGTWTDHLIIKSEDSGEEMIAWEVPQPLEGYENSYYFTEFAMQLNIPPEQYLGPIAETDSRYRPDQRALESGDIKTATSEKFRIEEKQRTARKLHEAEKTVHTPKWFSLQDGEWRYNEGYWAAKESGRFTNLPSLF